MARKHNAEIILRAPLKGHHVTHTTDGCTYALDDIHRLCVVGTDEHGREHFMVVLNAEFDHFIKMCERVTDEDIAALVFSLGMTQDEVRATTRNICGWCDLLYDGNECPSGCDRAYGINKQTNRIL